MDIETLAEFLELFGPAGMAVIVLVVVGRLYVRAQEDRIADLKAQMDDIEQLLRECLGRPR